MFSFFSINDFENAHIYALVYFQKKPPFIENKNSLESQVFLWFYPILSTIFLEGSRVDRKIFETTPTYRRIPPSRPSRPWPQVWVPQWWRCFSEAPGLLGEPYEVISKWSLYIYIFIYIYLENNGSPPNHPISIGVFQYFHHPFWGAPIFGNTVL